jgi:16S rRNA (guanine(966)-N(2))-methyltransferase RsmD
MRVIAGEFKGHQLVAPRGWKVRPTSERVREAVFSTLGDRIEGARVLDLYCGTGALAIEALSRGAARATLVDRDTRPALGNVERLGLGARAELVRAEAGSWLAAAAGQEAHVYDVVFVDAPYRLADLVAEELDTHLPGVLAADGRAVIESGARRPLAIGSLERLRQRRYGAADVSIYAGGGG